ncbi:MAG: thioredoxin family protein, partial [Armatimonadota bacterium]
SSLSLLIIAGLSLGATASSKELISKASQDAQRSGKNVLVIFHASWCGWCHRFDKFLDTTDEGKIVKNGLEVVHVTVMENDAKEKLNENEGGLALMEQLGGKDAGLPFMAILDAKTGKMITNSMYTPAGKTKATNTGYPAEPAEIAHFNEMLEKGAKKIKSADRVKVNAWLVANAPKH